MKERAIILFASIVLGLLYSFLLAVPMTLLWNWVLVAVFGIDRIMLVQAFGLLVFLRAVIFLFK